MAKRPHTPIKVALFGALVVGLIVVAIYLLAAGVRLVLG